MTTPFAQLGQMEKSAAAQGYKYQTGKSGLNNPYAPQVSTAPKPAGWTKGDTALLAADVGLGSIPVVGGLWGLGRAGWDAAHGNWAGAATNLGIAGLGAIGLGGAGALARAGATAGKIGLAARAASGVARVGAGTGRMARAANGLMDAGAGVAKLKGMGGTVFKGTSGVTMPKALPQWTGGRALPQWAAGKTVGKIGPITAGTAGVTAGGIATTQVVPDLVLPNNSIPAPQAPAPAPMDPNANMANYFSNILINGTPG